VLNLKARTAKIASIRLPESYGRILSTRIPLVTTPQEEALLVAFRRLPADAADQLASLVERLASLAPRTKIDWSDDWSAADLDAFTAASVRRLDEQEENH
jgi:hypothetical protein